MKKLLWIILAVMSVTLTASALDFFGVKLDQPIADVQAGLEKLGYKTDTITDISIVMTKTVNSEKGICYMPSRKGTLLLVCGR